MTQYEDWFAATSFQLSVLGFHSLPPSADCCLVSCSLMISLRCYVVQLTHILNALHNIVLQLILNLGLYIIMQGLNCLGD